MVNENSKIDKLEKSKEKNIQIHRQSMVESKM